ncbi:MAG TPA: hypothetical protein VKH19_05820 [Gemmatimonadaceae bacterium]|nr:hypothetical protein [Gemmatimonadaceae bacterium]
MTNQSIRRAALLAASVGLAACDVVAFATDPKPIFEQTWNLPAKSSSISVAELLPNSVSIYSTPGSNPPDSSAFMLSLNAVNFSQTLGSACSSCQVLNGTNSVKPAFVLNAGSSATLPPNVVSSAILGATLSYSVTNNFSFDPIRVRAAGNPTQGVLVVVIRSGSIVLGLDSVKGTVSTFPPGATLSRSISVSTANVSGAIAVDLVVDSPQGDHTEFINTSGSMQTSASVTNLRAGNVVINVPTKSIAPPPEDLDFGDLGSNVQSATLEMTVRNPWSVTGTVTLNFAAQGLSVTKPVTIPAGSAAFAPQVRTVTLDRTDLDKLEKQSVQLALTGTMNAVAPLTVTPRQTITIDNRIIFTLQTSGGK